MQTRTIATVLGVLGIVLSCAGKPTKGCVGAKGALDGASSVPSASSYVREGLIAMWDGIENAGWGTHDPNATSWKDLTGNHVLSYEFTPSFTEDAFVLPGDNKVAYCESPLWRDAVNANRCTVEICLKGYNFGGNNSPLALNYALRNNSQRSWWMWGKVSLSFKSSSITWSDASILSEEELVSLSFSNATLYKNGIYRISGTPGSDTSTSNVLTIGRIGNYSSSIGDYAALRADIHSIRIYNRALSAAEIAANYAIDKVRFGL